MKRLAITFSAAVGFLGGGCLEPYNARQSASSGPIYRHHFAGEAQINQGTNAAGLKRVMALPASAEVRQLLSGKLARAPQQFWKTRIPANAPDQSALWQPLFSDLIAAESIAEVRGAAANADTVLAVQLADDRAARWSTNLWMIAIAWNLGAPKSIAIEGGSGWEARQAKQVVQFARAGKWVVLGLGQDKPALALQWIQQIAKTGRPASALSDALLQIEADFPRLSQWFPGLATFRLPASQFAFRGSGEYVRVEGQLRYSQNLPVKLEPWKIPTDAILDPLCSFTAARGVAAVLANVKGVPELKLKETPNQFCLWGQAGKFAQTHFSVPAKDATNAIRELAPALPRLADIYLERNMGEFLYVSNRAELRYGPVPFADPQIRPARVKGQDFVLGSLFLVARSTNAAPTELFSQLESKPNLVYYDWEITQERLGHARQLYSFVNMLNHRQSPPTNAPTQKWILSAAPLLGNTITEVSLAGPKELSLVRKSHLGFTGFELATLARWLDSPGFPFTYEPPPSAPGATNRVNNQSASKTNAPRTQPKRQ